MSNRQGWRKGLGLAQIMATLLVVLPTIAFIVTFILEYWTIMQADYKLKLIANMSSDYYNSKEDTTDWSDRDEKLINPINANQLCPASTSLEVVESLNNQPTGQITTTVEYKYTQAVYITDKVVSTSMITYSYHDQNLSAKLECK